jgi:hypothetical protein
MKSNHFLIVFVLIATLLLAGCASEARVGQLRSESHAVELGDFNVVRVEIDMGAGFLRVSGGAKKLLEADITYNVDRLRPEFGYTDGTLVLQQPDIKGLPDLRGIIGYRNDWRLRLSDEVPMDLSVKMGGGASHMQLAGLSLTGLDLSLGAGEYTIDLSGDWQRDLHATIDAGAADIRLQLPKDVGARIQIDAGPTMIEATGLRRDGDVYTNDAYGVSEVTLLVNMGAGIGRIKLKVDEARALNE